MQDRSEKKCWRCDRTLGEAEGTGDCSFIMKCHRCKAKNRILFRDGAKCMAIKEEATA